MGEALAPGPRNQAMLLGQWITQEGLDVLTCSQGPKLIPTPSCPSQTHCIITDRTWLKRGPGSSRTCHLVDYVACAPRTLFWGYYHTYRSCIGWGTWSLNRFNPVWSSKLPTGVAYNMCWAEPGLRYSRHSYTTGQEG